jgi:hypothetical protein
MKLQLRYVIYDTDRTVSQQLKLLLNVTCLSFTDTLFEIDFLCRDVLACDFWAFEN